MIKDCQIYDFSAIFLQFLLMIKALRSLKQAINGRGYNINISNYYSNSTIIAEPDWQDREQQAVIAYHTMNQISMLRLLDNTHQFQKQSIANKVIAHGLELSNKGIVQNDWVLKPNNIDKVWEGFDPSIGAKVDLNIYKQDRFLKAAKNGRIVLLPSFVTGQIFHRLLSFEKGVSKQDDVDFLLKYVISGEKGSGKSFSYLTYDYLSQFILSYRMSNGYKLYSDRLFKFVPELQFKYVKKIFYVPLRQVSNINRLINHVGLHLNRQSLQELKGMKRVQRLKLLLQKFHDFHQDHNIKIMCIADEANYYYSSFRQMRKKNINFAAVNENSDEIDSTYTSQLRPLSNILSLIGSNVDTLVFNSSQAIQGKQITEWNSINVDRFFDIYVHKQCTAQDYRVGYSQYLKQNQGHVIIYQMFWENLVFFLSSEQKNTIDFKMKILRSYFNQVFGLQAHKNKSKKKLLNKWNVDVKYLNIRLTLNPKTNLLKDLQKLMQASNLDQLSIKKQLLKLKKSIQMNNYQGIKNRFRLYYNKAIDSIENSARFKIICWINQMAHEAMKQMQRQYNTDTNNAKNTIQRLKAKDRSSFLIDFTSYLMDNKLSVDLKKQIETQLNSFQQLIGIGYRDAQNINKFYFCLEPELLWKMTLLLGENFSKCPPLLIKLFLEELNTNRFVGNRMDALYFILFKQNYQFDFTVQKGRGLYNLYQTYKVKKCMPFQSRNSVPSEPNQIDQENQLQVNFAIQFKKLVQEAIKNKDNYILGFPSKQIFNQPILAPNNPYMDFLFIKQSKDQDNQQILMLHTYDYTVGDIDSKLFKLKTKKYVFYQLINNIQSMEELQKIKLVHKHFILAPLHKVIQYQKSILEIKKPEQQGNILKVCAFLQTPIYKQGDNDPGLIVGIRYINYFKMGEHITLPQKYKNQENSFFLLMKTVVESTLNSKSIQA